MRNHCGYLSDSGPLPKRAEPALRKQEKNVEQRRRKAASEKVIDHTKHIIQSADEYLKEYEATGRKNISKIEYKVDCVISD